MKTRRRHRKSRKYRNKTRRNRCCRKMKGG